MLFLTGRSTRKPPLFWGKLSKVFFFFFFSFFNFSHENNPSHLDAAVFSHLAIALFSPLPKKQLRFEEKEGLKSIFPFLIFYFLMFIFIKIYSAAIQRKPELVNYVINILQKYWSLTISVPVVCIYFPFPFFPFPNPLK